jgi:hypothetical protein
MRTEGGLENTRREHSSEIIEPGHRNTSDIFGWAISSVTCNPEVPHGRTGV